MPDIENRVKKNAILKHQQTSKKKTQRWDIYDITGFWGRTGNQVKNSCCSVIEEIKLEKSYKNFQPGITNVHQNIRGN